MYSELYKTSAAKFFGVDDNSHLKIEFDAAIEQLKEKIKSFEIKLHTDNHERLIEHLGLNQNRYPV